MKDSKKRKEIAPVLQGLKEYLDNHYMEEILQEIKAAMALGQVEELDTDCRAGEIIVDPKETRLARVEAWRVDRTNLIADCKLRLKFGVSKDGKIPRYVIRYIAFTADITLDGGIKVHQGLKDIGIHPLPTRDMPKLSNYLVPVLSYDEMEIMTQDMLRRYLGEKNALKDRENGADQLAAAMGLRVVSASLYKDHHTKAILYLKDGTASIVPCGVTGPVSDQMDAEEVRVPARTILLNENCSHQGNTDRTIYHECGHYDWHSMFYELQELHASDLRLLEYKDADESSAPAQKDISWIERQASFVSIAAMLPRPVFMPMVNRYWKEVINTRANLGEKIAKIICKIAEDRRIPKSLIRTRMISLGSAGAKGALNYVDEKYIPDFEFDTESLGPSETFVISRADFTALYEKDQDFRMLFTTHGFVYADGHVCCRQPEYVRKTQKGYVLTEWALGHVNECCLKFKKTYHYGEDKYRVGELHSDQEYNEAYLMIHSLDIEGLSREELDEKNLEYLSDLPRRPTKALKKLIKDRVRSQSALSAASGLSEATISRMCNDDSFQYSIQDVTRLCIGLELPPPLSVLLLDMTGFTRAVMVKYLRYQCIIDCMFMEDIDTVVKSHRKLFDN